MDMLLKKCCFCDILFRGYSSFCPKCLHILCKDKKTLFFNTKAIKHFLHRCKKEIVTLL